MDIGNKTRKKTQEGVDLKWGENERKVIKATHVEWGYLGEKGQREDSTETESVGKVCSDINYLYASLKRNRFPKALNACGPVLTLEWGPIYMSMLL